MSADETSNVPVELPDSNALSNSPSVYSLDDPLKFVQEISSASQNNLKSMWQRQADKRTEGDPSNPTGETNAAAASSSVAETNRQNLFTSLGFSDEEESLENDSSKLGQKKKAYTRKTSATSLSNDAEFHQDIPSSFALLKLNRAKQIWGVGADNKLDSDAAVPSAIPITTAPLNDLKDAIALGNFDPSKFASESSPLSKINQLSDIWSRPAANNNEHWKGINDFELEKSSFDTAYGTKTPSYHLMNNSKTDSSSSWQQNSDSKNSFQFLDSPQNQACDPDLWQTQDQKYYPIADDGSYSLMFRENKDPKRNESFLGINNSFTGDETVYNSFGEVIDNNTKYNNNQAYPYDNNMFQNMPQTNLPPGFDTLPSNTPINFMIPPDHPMGYKTNFQPENMYGEIQPEMMGKYVHSNLPPGFGPVENANHQMIPTNNPNLYSSQSNNCPPCIRIPSHPNYSPSIAQKLSSGSSQYPYDYSNQPNSNRINFPSSMSHRNSLSQSMTSSGPNPLVQLCNQQGYSKNPPPLNNSHRMPLPGGKMMPFDSEPILNASIMPGQGTPYQTQPHQQPEQQLMNPACIISNPSQVPLSNQTLPSYGMNYNSPVVHQLSASKKLVLLEECKNSPQKVRNLRLSQLQDQVVELARDQHGSRYIQQKLESATASEKNEVFHHIEPHANKLMTDVFGNYVIQKFFEFGTKEQKEILTERLNGHVVDFATQMYGCRVIQKALETVPIEAKIRIVSELRPYVIKCVKDQNGNHVIQKCIECVEASQLDFIISAFQGQVVPLSTHPYGCRVIQRILEHCLTDQIRPILEELHKGVDTLVKDQYGNYVIQHVLEHGLLEDKVRIISCLKGRVYSLSTHKFASNVMEKAITHSTPQERFEMINEILNSSESNDTDSNSNTLLSMMKDQYANYVVQRMLDLAEDPQNRILFNKIKPVQSSLKKFNYGKHIIMKLEKFNASKSDSSKSNNV